MSTISTFPRMNSRAGFERAAINLFVPRGYRNPLCSKLSERLLATRNRSGQKLYVVADLADVSQTTPGAVERGENIPALETLERLASALGVPVGWLAYGYEGLEPVRERYPRDFFIPSDPLPDPAWRVFRNLSAGFPRRLREARERSGLSMRTLSESAGISVQAWSKCEAGKVSPRVDTCERMAVALGIAPRWLAFGDLPVPLRASA